MKITSINKEHRDFFAEMDPLMYLERTDFPDRVSLGAFFSDEDIESAAGNDIPVGVLVYRKTENRIMIEWVCVSADYRYMGVGSALVGRVFEIASEAGIDNLEVYMNSEFGREQICLGEEDFIEDFLFGNEKKLFGEWFLGVKMLLKSEVMQEEEPEGTECRSLAFIGRDKAGEDIKAVLDRKYICNLFDMKALGIEPVDRDVSFIAYTNGKVSGALFTAMTGAALFVTLFTADKKPVGRALVRAAVTAAKEKYGPGKEVRIIKYTEDFTDIIEEVTKKLSGANPVENKVFSASVKQHFKNMDKFIPYVDDLIISTE